MPSVAVRVWEAGPPVARPSGWRARCTAPAPSRVPIPIRPHLVGHAIPAAECPGRRDRRARHRRRRDAAARRAPGRLDRSDPARGEGFEASIHRIKEQILPRLLERVDPEAAATLGKDELAEEFRPIIGEVLAELKLTLNRREQFALEKVLVDELLGLGPLEELLADTDITDIMVNGPEQTYVERKGLELANIRFRDEEHLFQVAQRIVNSVGRRVDQTTPLADARLKDGSRVNVIVPPLSLRGTAISIRNSPPSRSPST